MSKQRGPIVLLTEVNDSVRLDAHAQAGADRDILAERLLSRRSRCPVLTAGDNGYRRKCNSRKRPRTLHNSSLKNGNKDYGGGRKQAADNICHGLKARHPSARIASPCSSSRGGGVRTLPHTLDGTPVTASAPESTSASFTLRTKPHGTFAPVRTSIQCCALSSLTRFAITATTRSLAPTRPAFGRSAGSLARFSRPRAIAHACHCASLPTAVTNGRSAASNSW